MIRLLALLTSAVAVSASEEVSCGGQFTGTNGELHSPGWPGQYPDDADCEYHVTVPEGKVVALVFDVFDTEDNVADCRYDYVQVYDGASRSSPQMGLDKLCGDELPAEIRSTSQDLFMHFRSDHAVSSKGFRASYKAVDPESGTPAGCNRVFMADSGTLHSPGWPDVYPADLDCRYHIQVTDGKKVRVTFNSFDLEEGKGVCVYDWLQVFDGEIKENREIGSPICGSDIPEPITSSGRDLALRFASDGDGSGYGFHITWTAVDEESGDIRLELLKLLERDVL